MIHTFKCKDCERRKVECTWEYNSKHSFCPACGGKGLIVYDFACYDCGMEGKESYWQDTDMNTKCPECGARGERRIFAPHVADPTRREQYKFADRTLRKGLDDQGITRPMQREELPEAPKGPPPGMDVGTALRAGLVQAPFWGNPQEVSGLGQVAHARTLAEGNVTATEMGRGGALSKTLLTEVTVEKGDQAPTGKRVG